MQAKDSIHRFLVASLLPVLFILKAVHSGFLKTPLAIAAFGVYIGVVLIFVVFINTGYRKPSSVKVSPIDILLLVFICYRVLNGSVHPGTTYFSSSFLGELAIGFAYIVVRLRRDNSIPVIWSFIAVGLVESILAILQTFHLLSGNNEFFNITGTFTNPAQLAGFVAIQLFLLGALMAHYWRSISLLSKILLFLPAILFISVLLLSQSRASWLAVAIGCTYLLILKLRNTTTKLKPSAKAALLLFSIGSAIALLGLLYCYKKDSADGRLLIWRVTLDQITDNVLWGQGPGSFVAHYFDHQSNYFAQHPDSRFLLLAGNPSYAFNDYLQLTAELGLAGLSTIIAGFLLIFKTESIGIRNLLIKAALVAYCTFAFFSYPSQIFGLSIIPVILLALLPVPACSKIVLSRNVRLLALVAGAAFSICFSVYYGVLSNANRKLVTSLSDNNSTSIESKQWFTLNYPLLKYEPSFLYPYALYFSEKLGDTERLTVLQDAARQIPSVETHCKLGEDYLHLSRFREAEACFLVAANAVPSRLQPNYALFRLYAQRGDTISATTIGNKILKQTLKVENTTTIKAKASVKAFLNSLNDSQTTSKNDN